MSAANICPPSIVLPKDVREIAWANSQRMSVDQPAHNIKQLIQEGRLIVISEEVLKTPEVAKVIAGYIEKCLERQLMRPAA